MALPDSYVTTDGTPCYDQYTARDQGSCGSCYAFAAATAFSLTSFIAKSKAGQDATDYPMYSVQGLVSCGLEQGYTSGCDGGSGYWSYQYIIDKGVTTVGCWPYEQAGGSYEYHFDESGLGVAPCRSECVEESTISPMPKFDALGGPMSFNTESNIANALKTYG